jgi:hypothetical protein
VALGGLDAAVFGNVAYADFHPDYPLLVPALEAFAFRFDVGVRVVHVEFWLLLAAFTGALVELLRDRVGPLATWAAAIAVAWTPKFGAEALSANADIPLAVFLVLAALAAWLWVAEESMPALALVAVFGAACLATKLEGAPELGIVLAVAFVLALRRSRRRALGLVAAGGIAAAIALLPWRLWTAWHDVPQAYAAGEVADTLGSPEASRVPIATLLLLRQLFDPQVWLLLVPLALIALAVAAVAARRSRDGVLVALSTCVLVLTAIAAALVLPPASFGWRTAYWLLFLPAAAAGAGLLVGSKRVGGATAYVAAVTAALFCALVLVYLFTPYDFAWHLGTSAGRVVVPLGLLLVSFAPIVLDRTAPRRPGAMS